MPRPTPLRAHCPGGCSCPTAGAGRRARCRIPQGERHRAKWQLALDMLDELAAVGLRPAVLVADTGYGANADFRHGLEDRGLAYALQVRGEMTAHAEYAVPHQPPYGGLGPRPAMAPRIGKPRVMTAGLLVASAGYVALTLIRSDSGILQLVCALTVVSLGIAGVAAVVTDVILSAAPPERAGAASSLAETSAEFGGALGIAILGSIGTTVYRAQMESRAPAILTPEQLASAKGTLGGAVDTARTLPTGTAEALRNTAFDAFTYEWVAGVRFRVVDNSDSLDRSPLWPPAQPIARGRREFVMTLAALRQRPRGRTRRR
nr:transposase [Streptomyces sp. NBC_00378]